MTPPLTAALMINWSKSGPSRATVGPGETFSWGPYGEKIVAFFKMVHSSVLYIFERLQGPQTSWGRVLLNPSYPTFSTGLIKMHRTHSWVKCVLKSSISYFVVWYIQHKIFNTTKLLHIMALSVRLITKKWTI